MAAAKNELANLDEDWEEPPAAAQAQPAAVSSFPPDLGDLDDGWNADSSPLAAASLGESRRGVTPDGGQPESVPLPAAAWLTKRQRRELAKQQQRHAALRRAERKQARKAERREQARQRVAERPSSVVVRGATRDAQTARDVAATLEAAGALPRATVGRDARRSAPSTSGMARPERVPPARSAPQDTQRGPARARAVRPPPSAKQKRRSGWVLYVLMAVVVAALAAWTWLV
jgi:hypothetical protein